MIDLTYHNYSDKFYLSTKVKLNPNDRARKTDIKKILAQKIRAVKI